MGRELRIEVPPEAAGERIDVFLARDEHVVTRSSAERLLKTGAVSVGGSVAVKSRRLNEGETITVSLPVDVAAADPNVPAVPFEIVYEDEHLLVVDKPAGLVVHPGPGNRAGTLSQALTGRAAGGSAERPGIVHRLDKNTSGLIVVAKDDPTLRALQAALKARSVSREYLALVKGAPQSDSGTIDAPLGRDRRSPERVAVRADSPRPAVTHFAVLERFAGRTLLRVQLETGRTHQIRAHLAAIGLPVCGDPDYGVASDLGLERQFLHAARLSFEHPSDGGTVSFESTLPTDLLAALGRARSDGG